MTQSSYSPGLEGVIVLCIENEPQVLAGMESLLSNWGTHVLGAADLEAALALIKKSGVRPDVLLIDYHLDEVNGIEAIVRLRQDFGDDLRVGRMPPRAARVPQP